MADELEVDVYTIHGLRSVLINKFREDPETPEEQGFSERLADLISKKTNGAIILKKDDFIIRMAPKTGFSIEVLCKPNVLPAPFHKGMEIGGVIVQHQKLSDELIWDQFGRKVVALIEQRTDMCDTMREATSRVEKLCSENGMRLLGYVPTDFSYWIGKGHLGIRYEIEMIDRNLEEVQAIFFIATGMKQGFSPLLREATKQSERMARKTDGFITDSIMMNAIKKMPDYQIKKLKGFLKKNQNLRYSDQYGNETAKRAKESGISIPKEIETINTKNGLISGRVRISEGISFNRKVLLINQLMPETLMASMIGKKLRSVIDHPWLPEAKIIKVKTVNKQKTAITIEPELVFFPSGLKMKEKE